MVPIQCQLNGAECGVRPDMALHSPQQKGISPACFLAGEWGRTPGLALPGACTAAVLWPVARWASCCGPARCPAAGAVPRGQAKARRCL